MIAIVTGDIVDSRNESSANWLPVLKNMLATIGAAPTQWEIYRGDSFQLEVAPINALHFAVLLKSKIKQMETLDVRMGIGIGQKEFNAPKITEANGSAFVNSGSCFEGLKRRTLGVQSANGTFNEEINLVLDLLALTTDNWTIATATTIATALEHPTENQIQLAKRLEKSQSSISESLKRGGYDELLRVFDLYKKKVTQLS